MYSYVLEVVFLKIVLRKQPFFIVWGISMNSSGYNNHNKLLFSKIIVLIADYVSIVLGTLAAYYLRLNLPILPVSPQNNKIFLIQASKIVQKNEKIVVIPIFMAFSFDISNKNSIFAP